MNPQSTCLFHPKLKSSLAHGDMPALTFHLSVFKAHDASAMRQKFCTRQKQPQNCKTLLELLKTQKAKASNSAF